MNLRLCVAALLLLPSAAFAQGDPGPFGGLFGRTPERTGGDFTLFDIRSSLVTQVDDALLDGSQAAERRYRTGASGALNGGLGFERRSDRFGMSARSSATYQQALASNPVGGTSVASSAAVTGKVTARLTVDAAANHLYSPFFQFHPTLIVLPFNPAVVVPTSPYVATATASHVVDATAGFTSFYSKRSTLSASVSRGETRFPQQPNSDMSITGVQALWGRQLGRDFKLKLGYRRQHARPRSQPAAAFIHESIDAGIDFMRPLSLNRRTTMTFHTETLMMRTRELGREYRINGGVGISSWFRRTWIASLQVNRSTEFVSGFIEPLFSDTVGLSVTGLLSRKLEVMFVAAGGRGAFGRDDSKSARVTTSTATSQINYALTRHLALFGQHAFVFYQLPPGTVSASPLARLSRQTVTVGITTWIPLILRERTPSDPR